VSPVVLGTAYILLGGSPGDASQIGPDENDPTTDAQTPTWYELVQPEHFYQYPASKLEHAKDAMGRGVCPKYANYDLVVIGYSAGADSALLFAEMYYSYKDANNTPGNIIGIALLGPTMSDDTGYLDTDWKRIMNDLLIERGTKIYAINDNGGAGDALEDYRAQSGYFASTYEYDLQDNRFCDAPDYNPEVDRKLGEPCHGRDHWSTEHLTPGWATYGTNNDPDFRDRVIDWLTN